MMELLSLKQTEAEVDSRKQFEELVYHIKMFDKLISKTIVVTLCILGLKLELRSLVEI